MSEKPAFSAFRECGLAARVFYSIKIDHSDGAKIHAKAGGKCVELGLTPLTHYINADTIIDVEAQLAWRSSLFPAAVYELNTVFCGASHLIPAGEGDLHRRVSASVPNARP